MAAKSNRFAERLLRKFANRFRAQWDRGFPKSYWIDGYVGRADITVHIANCVRSSASNARHLTYFEHPVGENEDANKNFDAVIKNVRGERIANLEWEWDLLRRKGSFVELRKLRHSRKSACFSVLITYTKCYENPELGSPKKDLKVVKNGWNHDEPLLLILVSYHVGEAADVYAHYRA